MKIDPTGRLPQQPLEQVAPAARKPQTPPPADQVEISGRANADATYSRAPVPNRAAEVSSLEVHMAQDARAQKLAEVRSRMDAGVYNSRDLIEKVVDRLLDRWKLGPAEKPDSTA
jgi:hypothetical protein